MLKGQKAIKQDGPRKSSIRQNNLLDEAIVRQWHQSNKATRDIQRISPIAIEPRCEKAACHRNNPTGKRQWFFHCRQEMPSPEHALVERSEPMRFGDQRNRHTKESQGPSRGSSVALQNIAGIFATR